MSGILFPQQLALQSHHCWNGKWWPRVKISNGSSASFPSWEPGDANSPKISLKLLPPHASVSGSSGAQFTGAETKKKKQRIAGIDQDELLDPAHLADPDSCFCEFRGVQIHHKVYEAESQALDSSQSSKISQQSSKKIGFPMILLHGFGASVYSWSRVMKPLAEVVGSKVLAFDRPAFGLTARVDSLVHSATGSQDTKPLNPYSMAFSVLATLYFINFLAAEKVVLVGHSAGSLVAVDVYFDAPERIAALILVAPAIVAPLASSKATKGNNFRGDNYAAKEKSNSNTFTKLLGILSQWIKYLTTAILQTVKGMTDMLSSLYKKALAAILRSAFGIMLVRMIIDKFGIAAVRYAWYDKNQVDDHVLNGYTKPLRTKGWDKALAEFTAATLASVESESKPPLSKRLHEISCPVLIVTGDSDQIVPSWNAERLSSSIPGSYLQVIKNCGHLPHEEKVEEFVDVVRQFLQTVFGDQEEPSLTAAGV